MEEQQSLQALEFIIYGTKPNKKINEGGWKSGHLGPRHHPSCPPTQPRTYEEIVGCSCSLSRKSRVLFFLTLGTTPISASTRGLPIPTFISPFPPSPYLLCNTISKIRGLPIFSSSITTHFSLSHNCHNLFLVFGHRFQEGSDSPDGKKITGPAMYTLGKVHMFYIPPKIPL